jgi:DNA-directed RNA polymerase specialized sigma24 family protein
MMKIEKENEVEEIARLGLAGDRQGAFKLILSRYQEPIYYFLRQFNLNHEDADEQVQEIFVRIWKQLISWTNVDMVDILIYRFAIEASQPFLRKHGEPVPYSLTPEQRIVFNLKQYAEFDYREIAAITGLPVNDVRQNFNDAIKLICTQIKL